VVDVSRGDVPRRDSPIVATSSGRGTILKYGQQCATIIRRLGRAVNEEGLVAVNGWIGRDPPIRGERLDREVAGVLPGGARGPFLWIGLRRGANRFIIGLPTMNGLASPIKEDNSAFIMEKLSAWKRNLSSGLFAVILNDIPFGTAITSSLERLPNGVRTSDMLSASYNCRCATK